MVQLSIKSLLVIAILATAVSARTQKLKERYNDDPENCGDYSYPGENCQVDDDCCFDNSFCNDNGFCT